MSVVLTPTRNSSRVEQRALGQAAAGLAGASVIVLIVLLRERLPGWAVMWLVASAIFGTFKLVALLHLDRCARVRLGLWRTLAYLFLWPGTGPGIFLPDTAEPTNPGNLWRNAAST